MKYILPLTIILLMGCSKDKDPVQPSQPPAPPPAFSGTAPTPIAPNGPCANPPSFIWSKVPDAVGYRLRVEREQLPGVWFEPHVGLSNNVLTDTTWTPTGSYGGSLQNGLRWQVKAKGADGTYSDWTAVTYFDPW